MLELFFLSLAVAVVGSVYCLYRWEDIKNYNKKPASEKRLIMMYMFSTITFIVFVVVFVITGKAPV